MPNFFQFSSLHTLNFPLPFSFSLPHIVLHCYHLSSFPLPFTSNPPHIVLHCSNSSSFPIRQLIPQEISVLFWLHLTRFHLASYPLLLLPMLPLLFFLFLRPRAQCYPPLSTISLCLTSMSMGFFFHLCTSSLTTTHPPSPCRRPATIPPDNNTPSAPYLCYRYA